MKHRTVASLMTHDVVAVSPETTFKEIATLLTRHDVSAVPVTDVDRRVVGVVSEADLLRRFQPPPHRLLRSRPRKHTTVAATLMTTPAVTVGADADVVTAARLLGTHHVKRLPVVDVEGRLVGIVSRHDLVGVFVRPDEEIGEEIRQDVVLRGMFVDPSQIEVQVRDGVVTLRGQLERASMVAILGTFAGRVDGVVDTVNELTYEYDDNQFGDGTRAQNVGILHDIWDPR